MSTEWYRTFALAPRDVVSRRIIALALAGFLRDLLETSMQSNDHNNRGMSRPQPGGSNREPDMFEQAFDFEDDEPPEGERRTSGTHCTSCAFIALLLPFSSSHCNQWNALWLSENVHVRKGRALRTSRPPACTRV